MTTFKPILKQILFPLPHVGTIRRRWLRRVVIIIAMPQALAQAILAALGSVFAGAKFWWNLPTWPLENHADHDVET